MLSPTAASQNQQPFLEVRNVTKTFGRFVALADVSLKVFPGELVCILGPSGCGKTTLLRVIAGLEEQNAGEIYLKGTDISRYPTSKRECGIVFQSYALFPNLTASQNIAYGLKSSGYNREEKAARTRKMLELVDLGGMGKKYPAQLSGGQQQRVALSRALAPQPSMLLLDEPLSALDAQVRVHLRSEIRELQQRLDITTIMVTHDQEEGLTMADRIILMDEGKIIQCDSPQKIYKRPATPFVAGFIGAMNFMENWVVADENTLHYGPFRLKTDKGAVDHLIDQRVTIAIRPEDIRVLEGNDAGENKIPVNVRNIEFRGVSYRLRLRMETDTAGHKAQVFEADLPSEKIDRLGIEKNHLISVHIPADRLLFFNPRTSKPAN
jgi:iron(III) transport system ATP-binding protein